MLLKIFKREVNLMRINKKIEKKKKKKLVKMEMRILVMDLDFLED